MKSLFAIRTALALLLSTLQISLASAENASSARWLRQNAISPDGSCIAFAYQGDIFLVPSQGGLARQLTSNPAHDTEPLWSADGKWIVFASVREGSKDLWAISAEGGAPRRLTCYGGSETPLAMTPDGNVLFSANIEDVPGSSVFTHSSTTPIPKPAIIPTQFFHPLLLQYPHTAKPTMKYSSMWMLDRKLLYST